LPIIYKRKHAMNSAIRALRVGNNNDIQQDTGPCHATEGYLIKFSSSGSKQGENT